MVMLTVEHVVLAQLGKEHIAHTAYRHGSQGDSIIAWGSRILEWPLAAPHTLQEVVAVQPGLRYSNGGCTLDVDGDGVEELVVSRGKAPQNTDPQLFWFKERPGHPTWKEHKIADLGTGPVSPHDIQPLLFQNAHGEGIRGVVVLIDRHQLVWYQIPVPADAPWIRQEIGTFPTTARQSGMVIGNIAGHGRPDVVCGMFWAECPADPTRRSWTLHRFGTWDDNGWGGMAKLALGDLDGDGKLEIVASEAEIQEARLGIFRRDPNQPEGPWHCHRIDSDLYCPHSLGVADVDGDGRLDIIVGEMRAGGWSFPLHANPRILAYLNQGAWQFERQVLEEGWGIHEMGLAQSQAGRTLICAADEIQWQKFPQMETHVSYWTIFSR